MRLAGGWCHLGGSCAQPVTKTTIQLSLTMSLINKHNFLTPRTKIFQIQFVSLFPLQQLSLFSLLNYLKRVINLVDQLEIEICILLECLKITIKLILMVVFYLSNAAMYERLFISLPQREQYLLTLKYQYLLSVLSRPHPLKPSESAPFFCLSYITTRSTSNFYSTAQRIQM